MRFGRLLDKLAPALPHRLLQQELDLPIDAAHFLLRQRFERSYSAGLMRSRNGLRDFMRFGAAGGRGVVLGSF